MNLKDRKLHERDLERFPPKARGFYKVVLDIHGHYVGLVCLVCDSAVSFCGEELEHDPICPVPYAQLLMLAEDYTDKKLYEREDNG